MKLTRNELKNVMYDFNRISNRLMDAHYCDYEDVLKKFMAYIESSPIIMDFIDNYGICSIDIAEEVSTVQSHFGSYCYFELGNTRQEEVGIVFGILKYLVDNNISVTYGVAFGYSTSDSYQEKINGFNKRFVKVLIDHIETHLTRIGIDMGIDEKAVFNVTVHDGQVIIANDNAMVTSNNSFNFSRSEYEDIVEELKGSMDGLSEKDKQDLDESLEVIGEEIAKRAPRKSMLNVAMKTIKGIKGSAEFLAAVTSLYTFISAFL